MATKKNVSAIKAAKRSSAAMADTPTATSDIPAQLQEFLKQTSVPKGFVNSKQLALLDPRGTHEVILPDYWVRASRSAVRQMRQEARR